ncbi:MAG: hypothetical protein IJ875_04060, partial [Solobacterium sp.]|nr:hypothetical protein [Solobacterium sp.]
QVIVWDEPSTLSEEEKWNESDALTFANRIVKIDGVKYKIPCALYRFIENGWSVDISGNNNHSIVYVATEQMDNFVSLTKGDKEIKIVSAVSPIDTQVMVDESFIGGFTIFSWTNVDVEFAKGLACGMAKEEVDNLLKEEKLDGNMLQKDGDNYQLTLEEKNGSKIKESIYQIKFKEDKVDQIRMEVRYQ